MFLRIDGRNLLGDLDTEGDVSPSDERVVDESLAALSYDVDELVAKVYKSSLECWMVAFLYRCKYFLGLGSEHYLLRQNKVLHLFASATTKLANPRPLVAVCYQLALKLNNSFAKELTDEKNSATSYFLK